jgi:Domain of unknown function (DUF1918)
MRAKKGDKIIVDSGMIGGVRHVGLIVGLPHQDGTPPYRVRWMNNDHEGLYFPGPNSHIEPSKRSEPARPTRSASRKVIPPYR